MTHAIYHREFQAPPVATSTTLTLPTLSKEDQQLHQTKRSGGRWQDLSWSTIGMNIRVAMDNGWRWAEPGPTIALDALKSGGHASCYEELQAPPLVPTQYVQNYKEGKRGETCHCQCSDQFTRTSSLSLSRVCQQWKGVICSKGFLPQRKLFYRYKANDEETRQQDKTGSSMWHRPGQTRQ